MKTALAVLLALTPVSAVASPIYNDSQPGYSNQRSCFKTEYREEYIQGTEDNTVDWRCNIKQLETKFSGSKTYLINGGRHHLVNESHEFREVVLSLIDQVIE